MASTSERLENKENYLIMFWKQQKFSTIHFEKGILIKRKTIKPNKLKKVPAGFTAMDGNQSNTDLFSQKGWQSKDQK